MRIPGKGIVAAALIGLAANQVVVGGADGKVAQSSAFQYVAGSGVSVGGPTPNIGASGWAITVGVPDGQATDAVGRFEVRGRRAGADGSFAVIDAFNQSASTGVAGRMGRFAFLRDGADNSGTVSVNTVNAGVIGEVARWTAGGNMLAGSTTNGTGKLQVTISGTPEGLAAGVSANFVAYGAGNINGFVARDITNDVEFYAGTVGTAAGAFIGSSSSHPLSLITAGSIRAVIDTSGNMTLGHTSTATSRLDIVRALASGSQVRIGVSSSDSGMYFTSGSAAQGIMSAGAAYNGTTWIAKSTTQSTFECNGGNFYWFGDTGLTATNAFTQTERMRLNTNGQLQLGSATAGSGRLQVTLGGAVPETTTASGGVGNIVGYAAGNHHNITRDVTNDIEMYWGTSGTTIGGFFGTSTAHPFSIYTNAVQRISVNTTFGTNFLANVAGGPSVQGWNTANGTTDYLLKVYGLNNAGAIKAGMELQLNGSQNDAYMRLYIADATNGLVEAAQFLNTTTNNETCMLIRRRNNSGAYTFERVTLGNPDSAGTGKRALAVTNG